MHTLANSAPQVRLRLTVAIGTYYLVVKMTDQYSNVELVEMVRLYAISGDNVSRAIEMFAELFPNRQRPSHRVMLAATQRLRDHRQFDVPQHAEGRGNEGLPVALQEDILEFFRREPRASTREAGRRFGVHHSTVWRLLHKEMQHPFHYRKVQDLHQQDNAARVTFCRWLLEHQDANILWTDECLFTRVGVYNVHNEHWWAHREHNPHVTKRHSFQVRFSLNVWAGIIGDQLLGPYFIDGHLTSATYLEMLQYVVEEMLEEVPLAVERNMYYQQDGAPPHYGRQVREYLSDRFGTHWIGRGGPVAWPPRSPDLTPLDFYLWGDVKRLVYTDEITSVTQLRAKVISAFDTIKTNVFVLRKLKENQQRRARLCLECDGGNFEQYLQVT